MECRSGVHDGSPVIKGTRFPVTSIAQNYRRGLSADEILREFPSLSAAQVYDALSYYHDHREQIDEALERLSNVEAAAQQFPPTLCPDDDAD